MTFFRVQKESDLGLPSGLARSFNDHLVQHLGINAHFIGDYVPFALTIIRQRLIRPTAEETHQWKRFRFQSHVHQALGMMGLRSLVV